MADEVKNVFITRQIKFESQHIYFEIRQVKNEFN